MIRKLLKHFKNISKVSFPSSFFIFRENIASVCNFASWCLFSVHISLYLLGWTLVQGNCYCFLLLPLLLPLQLPLLLQDAHTMRTAPF